MFDFLKRKRPGKEPELSAIWEETDENRFVTALSAHVAEKCAYGEDLAALSPAEKLKVVQGLMDEGDARAAAIYRSIGVYLAHSLALYHDMYHFRHVLLLGRVMSGRGGELVIEECGRVLRDEYSELADMIHLALPDEKFRRVGQSAAAASLPENRK